MTAHSSLRKYSTELAPRFPLLKLSMKRTVLDSRGTVVPPDYLEESEILAQSVNVLLQSAGECMHGWKLLVKAHNL